MSIRISQIKDHYISVYQARYDTSFVAKYLDTATIEGNSISIRLTYLMIIYSLKELPIPDMNKWKCGI